jgi:hypothetical protein
MNLNLPWKLRATIYVLVVLGTAVLVPLNIFHIVSDVVMAVWTSVGGAASGLAALNVQKPTDGQ